MTKSKPQMKREVAIVGTVPSLHVIHFDGTPDAAREFASFGQVTQFLGNPGRYQLTVDKRYDFAEVLKYIEEYG